MSRVLFLLSSAPLLVNSLSKPLPIPGLSPSPFLLSTEEATVHYLLNDISFYDIGSTSTKCSRRRKSKTIFISILHNTMGHKIFNTSIKQLKAKHKHKLTKNKYQKQFPREDKRLNRLKQIYMLFYNLKVNTRKTI